MQYFLCNIYSPQKQLSDNNFSIVPNCLETQILLVEQDLIMQVVRYEQRNFEQKSQNSSIFSY